MQALPPYESSTYAFSARELERLSIYRAAVEAEFYTDRCDPLNMVPEVSESVWRLPQLSSAI